MPEPEYKFIWDSKPEDHIKHPTSQDITVYFELNGKWIDIKYSEIVTLN